MIEVNNLTKKYGSNTALDRASFAVQDGEILGLLGLNGAGKSTTMNLITGYIGATAGTVRVQGFDIAENALKAKAVIGYLPEQPPLYLDMKVCEYLEFVCGIKKVKNGKGAHVEEICRETGIADVSGRVIKNLSKGYKQRVGLAQALIGDPKVLILDEPTVGLDPSQIIEIRSLIKKLGQSRTVILSSHILPEVREVCDRVVVLHQGKMIADDTPENLSRRFASPDVVTACICGTDAEVASAVQTLAVACVVRQGQEKEPGVYEYVISGPEGSDIRRDLFRALAKADLPMLAIKGSDLSLEDIFLKLINKEEDLHDSHLGS